MNYRIATLGCKVNQFETQAMEERLLQDGHRPAADGEAADAVIVNTCAVTAESGRKSRQMIRRLKEENPDAVVAVCGCYAQLSPEENAEIGADVIFGSGDRMAFVKAVERAVEQDEKIWQIDRPFQRKLLEPLPGGAVAGRTRAMLKIQDGCSNFCSYCIIPYARGPVRSMPLEEIRKQSAAIAADGYREIVITGIEISSYGRDLGASLIDAIAAVSEAAPGLRIRLGSLEPRTATEEFCRRAAEIPGLCPHFHMSLQSGCDATLKRMNRKYDMARYAQCIANLRRYFPGCAVTTDVIVGFPGETEADFQACLAFMEACAFAAVHVFPYSPRPGTPAAGMPGQIENAEKHRRSVIAGDLARELSHRYAAKMIGQDTDVLFERERDGFSYGHSPNYMVVRVPGTGLRNVVKTVHITGMDGTDLCGNIL